MEVLQNADTKFLVSTNDAIISDDNFGIKPHQSQATIQSVSTQLKALHGDNYTTGMVPNTVYSYTYNDFSIGGEICVLYSWLHDEHGLDWVLSVSVPRVAFTRPAIIISTAISSVSAVITVIAIIAGVVILVRLAKAFSVLLKQMEYVQLMQLDELDMKDSKISEIKSIQQGFRYMVTMLKEYRAFLPSSMQNTEKEEKKEEKTETGEKKTARKPEQSKKYLDRWSATTSMTSHLAHDLTAFSLSLESREIMILMVHVVNVQEILNSVVLREFSDIHSELTQTVLKAANRYGGDLSIIQYNNCNIDVISN